MSLGLRQATLSLQRYDPIWLDMYEAEAALIAEHLCGISYRIAHIGSTAVPDLEAKPILDIAMQSAQQRPIAATLIGLGYIDRGMRSGHLFIKLRDGDVRTHNLHLYGPGDEDFRDQVLFRDVLRSDTFVRDQYANLKQGLVRRLGDKGRGQYADAKTDFIKTVVTKKRAELTAKRAP